MRRVLIAVLLFPMLHPFLSAQGGEQPVRIVGKAVDARGRPWSGARVTLVSRENPRWDSRGTHERVEVTTDARGRFEARCRGDRRYTVWAGETSADGLQRISGAHEFVVPGASIVLRQELRPRRRVRVQIAGVDLWKERGPFRYVVRSGTGVVWSQDLEPTKDGVLLLPRLPGRYCYVAVYDRTGLEIGHRMVEISTSDWEATQRRHNPKVLAGARDGDFLFAFLHRTMKLGVPVDVEVRVKDPSGKPITGAHVVVEERSDQLRRLPRRTVVAKTGKAGGAKIVVSAYPAADGSLYLVHRSVSVAAKGYARRGVAAILLRNTTAVRDVGRPRVEQDVELRPSAAVSGRVLLRPGLPAKGVTLALFTKAESASFPHSVELVTADDDGRFVADHRDVGTAYGLCALLDAASIARLAVPTDGRPIHNMAWLAVNRGRTKRATDLGDVVIDELVKVDVGAIRADGTPASRPEILVAMGKPGDRPVFQDVQRLFASRVGRVRLLMPAGARFEIAAATTDVGFQAAQVDTSKAEDGVLPLELRMEPPVPVSGKVVDERGRPLVGIRMFLFTGGLRNGSTVYARFDHTWARSSVTDRKGRFRCRAVAGADYQLVVQRPTQGGGFDWVPVGYVSVGSQPEVVRDIQLHSGIKWYRESR